MCTTCSYSLEWGVGGCPCVDFMLGRQLGEEPFSLAMSTI